MTGLIVNSLSRKHFDQKYEHRKWKNLAMEQIQYMPAMEVVCQITSSSGGCCSNVKDRYLEWMFFKKNFNQMIYHDDPLDTSES